MAARIRQLAHQHDAAFWLKCEFICYLTLSDPKRMPDDVKRICVTHSLTGLLVFALCVGSKRPVQLTFS